MKRTTLILTLAAVLLLASLICPVTAGAGEPVRTVQNGDDVFIYETIHIPDAETCLYLPIEALPQEIRDAQHNNPSLFYQYFPMGRYPYSPLNESDFNTSFIQAARFIYPDENGNFNLSSEELSYPFIGRYFYNSYPVTGDTPSVTIKNTQMDLMAYVNSTGDYAPMVTILANTSLNFVITVPQIVWDNTGATVKLEFATPNGGKTTTFGGRNFDNISVNDNETCLDPVAAGETAQPGLYAVHAEYLTINPEIFSMPDAYKKSNAIFFTIEGDAPAGELTMTASGSGSYALGEEITLSGINTDTGSIWLFITGPNLIADGEILNHLPSHVPAGMAMNPHTFIMNTDFEWKYFWDTASCDLDAGDYTIYATSVQTNGKAESESAFNNIILPKISDSAYDTVTITLTEPTLTGDIADPVVEPGSTSYIQGTATGDPQILKMYVFGQNFYYSDIIYVSKDGNYEKQIEFHSSMAPGQYHAIIEHPMYNGMIDVTETGMWEYQRTLSLSNQDETGSQASFIVWGPNKLQGSDAADALEEMLSTNYIDDIYVRFSFTIDGPWLDLISPETLTTGSTLTLSGTTTLEPGSEILLEVLPETAVTTGDTVYSGLIPVTTGTTTAGNWSVVLSTLDWEPGTYLIKASADDVFTSAKLTLEADLLGSLAVIPGWNFISVPKTLAPGNNTAAALFGNVGTDGIGILIYDANRSVWTTLTGTDIIRPMTGIWIYANQTAKIPLTYPDTPTTPATKTLYPGWNAVGLSAGQPTAATNALSGTSWRTLLPWNIAAGSWDAAIVKDGTGANSPDRLMTTGNGYWLYVTEEGVLTGLTA